MNMGGRPETISWLLLNENYQDLKIDKNTCTASQAAEKILLIPLKGKNPDYMLVVQYGTDIKVHYNFKTEKWEWID